MRLRANKAELLAVLERPEIRCVPTAPSGDTRCHAIKRKISGGTHSDARRDCRDVFLGLMHTATVAADSQCNYLTGALPGLRVRGWSNSLCCWSGLN